MVFDKSNISQRANIELSAIEFACPATYHGGDIKNPVKKPEEGCIGLIKDNIVFVNLAFLKKNQLVLTIPIKKLINDEIEEISSEDADYKNLMTSMSFFAGHGPMSSFSKQIRLLKISFLDEKNMKQKPLFEIKKPQFQRLLYEKV